MEDLKEKAILMYREFLPLYAKGIISISSGDIHVGLPLFKSFCPDSAIVTAEKIQGYIHLYFKEDDIKFVAVI